MPAGDGPEGVARLHRVRSDRGEWGHGRCEDGERCGRGSSCDRKSQGRWGKQWTDVADACRWPAGLSHGIGNGASLVGAAETSPGDKGCPMSRDVAARAIRS